MSTRVRRLVAATASLALLALGVAACSGDEDSSDDSGGATTTEMESFPEAASDGSLRSSPDQADALADAARAPAEREGGVSAFEVPEGADVDTRVAAGGGSPGDVAGTPEAPVPDPAAPRSLIKTGNVALRSTDVADTLFEVRKVLQQTGGEVAEDETQADDSGDPERSLLTVRVPVDQFETALEGLKTLGTAEAGVDLIDSSSASNDVSTQVIDTDVRVELQRRSIDRISILLDRATSIRDIVSIERELARREADLGSLQKRQAFLADQTSRSTITISIERPKEKVVNEKKVEGEEETGFVAGLTNGWDAFQDVTTGLLTGAGALLPFAILALLVGIPLRTWLRRRQSSPAPTPATPVNA